MALFKELITDFGQPVTYHRIGCVHYYHDHGVDHEEIAHIDVHSYYNQAARENGYPPADQRQLSFTGENCPFSPDNITMAAAYAAVKTDERYADAQDV